MFGPGVRLLMGAAFALAQSQGQNSAAALTGMGFALLVLYAVLLLYVPYQYIFTGLMYLSRTRERGEVGSVWGAGANGQNPPYGQQGYPPHGYGQQGPYGQAHYPPQGPGSTPQG